MKNSIKLFFLILSFVLVLGFSSMKKVQAYGYEYENETAEVTNNSYMDATKINLETTVYCKTNGEDDLDWYEFTLLEDGYISINFRHSYKSDTYTYWKIWLYKKGSSVTSVHGYSVYHGVSGTYNYNTNNIGLNAGTYCILIEPATYINEEVVDYNLYISFTSSHFWEAENNGTSYQYANFISLNKEYYGSITSTNGVYPNFSDYSDVDWYKVNVPQDGTMNLEFKHDPVDNSSIYTRWHIQVYSSDGILGDLSNDYLKYYKVDGYNDKITDLFNVLKGTYYIRVYGDGSHSRNIDYSLKVNHNCDKQSVTGISFSNTSLRLNKNQSFSPSYNITPSYATYTDVTWSSSDESVAIVNKYGRVTAINPGVCEINVTTVDGGFTASMFIYVDCGDYHDFSAKIESSKYLNEESTCTTFGTYFYSCSICQEKGTETFSASTLKDHSYINNPDEICLKSEASCTQYASYYESCRYCGKLGSKTFFYGNKLNHTFGDYVYNNDATCKKNGTETAKCLYCDEVSVRYKENTKLEHTYPDEYLSDGEYHWKKCSVCSTLSDKLEHSGGVASCNVLAKCEVCEVYYGEYKPHGYDDEYLSDGEYHWQKCTLCSSPTEKVPHSGGLATCTSKGSCEICNTVYLYETDHRYSEGYLLNDSCHWKVCLDCGVKGQEEDHYGGLATCTTKAICEGCGVKYGDTLPHTYTEGYSGNDTEHWRNCTGCDSFIDKEVHHGGVATCTTKAICIDCYVSYGDYAHHTYPSTYLTDGNHHWQRCTECAALSEKVEHHGGHATCTTYAYCDACGNTYGSYASHVYSDTFKSDSNYHWKQCTNCSSITERTKHLGGTATCTTLANCTICYTEYGALKEHVLEIYNYNSEEHIFECSNCHEYNVSLKHIYDYDCDESCNECAYIRTVEHVLGKFEIVDHNQHKQLCAKTGCTYYELSSHNYDEGLISKLPTLDTPGTMLYTCLDCKYEKTVQFGASEHDHEFGTFLHYNSEYHWTECACGTKSELLKHNYEEVKNTPSTCTRNGEVEFKCKDCGNYTSEMLPLIEHDFKHVVIPSTCTKIGKQYDECSSCHLKKNEISIQQKQHIAGEWQLVETEDGSTMKVQYCKNCDEMLSWTTPSIIDSCQYVTLELVSVIASALTLVFIIRRRK